VSFIASSLASRQLRIACGQFSRQFIAALKIPFGNLSEKRAVRSLAKTFIAPVNRSYVEQKKAQVRREDNVSSFSKVQQTAGSDSVTQQN
jgi:hypothetical protein